MPGDGSQDLVVAGRRLRKKLVVALTLSSAVPLLVLAYVVRAFVLPSRAAGDSLVFGGVQALVAFTVFVQPDSARGTDIQVNAKMRTQAYRRGSTGKLKSDHVFQCVSTGRFEANLGDTVRRLVKE